MEEKVIRKLKLYDSVVSIGRKKYSQDYIEYAKGYLHVYRDIIISDRLGLKNCNYGFGMGGSGYNGYRKGYADLMTWRAKNKRKE